MEDLGRTYVCCWKRLEDGRWESWVRRRKDIRVQVSQSDDLMMALTYAIEEHLGDCEPQIEFEPALPVPGVSPTAFDGGHVRLHASSSCRIDEADGPSLFAGGICSLCRSGLGERTKVNLRMTSCWPGDAVSTVTLDCHFQLLLVSEPVVTLLRSISATGYDLLAAELAPRKRKRLWEIRPQSFVDEAAIKGVAVSGSRCGRCNWARFGHHPAMDILIAFVDGSLLSKTSAPLFFLGSPSGYKLCVRGDVWATRKAEFRKLGLTASQLGVLDSAMIDPAPALKPVVGRE